MLVRVISGILLISIITLVYLPGGNILAGFLLLLSLIGYTELLQAHGILSQKSVRSVFSKKTTTDFPEEKEKNGRLLLLIGCLDIILYYVLMVFAKDPLWMFMMVVLTLISFMLLYVFTFPKYSSDDIITAVFSFVYLPVMLSFAYMIRELPEGAFLVWFTIICSWVCDTCAYFTGVAIGKHKMAPVLSPKKSIEGAIGGVVGSAIVGFIFGYFAGPYMDIPGAMWLFPVLGAAGGAFSQIGDLAASGIKRNKGIKDYGDLIPGHGGIMDRFDAFIFVTPVIYIFARIFM